MRLLPGEGLFLGVVGVTGVFEAEDSGEVRLEFVTFCSSEDNPGKRKKLGGGCRRQIGKLVLLTTVFNLV